MTTTHPFPASPAAQCPPASAGHHGARVERGGTPDSESVPDPRELEQAAQAVANISLPADLGNISVNVSENGVRVRGGPGDTIDVTVPVNPPPVAAPTPQEITPSP